MSEIATLAATPRPASGTGPARAERRAGRVPAIVYGGEDAPTMVSVDTGRLDWLLGRGGFTSTLFRLEIEGGKPERVIPKDIQRHPVTDRPLHIDFLRVAAGATVQVPVAISYVNVENSPGSREGGVLRIVRHEVEIVCPAESIPEALVIDLSDAELGQTIRSSDLDLPEGAQFAIDDRDFMLASLAKPSGRGMEDEEAGAEGEDGEGAPEGAGDEGGEESGGDD